MINIANEFNYKITAFHHGVEAYKIADLLAENNKGQFLMTNAKVKVTIGGCGG